MILIECAIGCGNTDRVPVIVDHVKKTQRPAGPARWVCLACWLKGYRSEGEKIYQLVGGHRVPVGQPKAP